MKLEVHLENAGRNWAASAFSEEIFGTVVATGKTRSSTIREFRSALKFHLDGLREDGRAVPTITELEIRELVPA